MTLGGERLLRGTLLLALLLTIGGCLPSSQADTDPAGADDAGKNGAETGDGADDAETAAAGSTSARPGPNILFVLTDDQNVASVSEMPKVRSLLAEEGTTFDRAFATTPLCCPSRSSILRGQYAHSHRVWTNRAPDGGFGRVQELGLEDSTVATWLHEAGYHTGYMGKYLNEYGSYNEPTAHVPPGWDRWIGYEGGPGEQARNGSFKVNNGEEIVRVNAKAEHDTDFLARKAEDYIRNRNDDNPWFLAVGTNAPHTPAEASRRNDGTFAGRAMPKTPAFNEADVSDKASIWRDNPRLGKECPRGYRSKPDSQCLREATQVWRDRMESLQDVDDMVGGLMATLREEGFLENTYVVFTSDNGFQMYDNRVFSKGAPYENSQGVPLIVRGPGVAAGRVDSRLVANIDLAPTFAGWAGVPTPPFVEGRSLVPILEDPEAQWRKRLLFEHRLGDHDYDAVRTSEDEVYIEYPLTGETEYYDLKTDPYQLDGKAKVPPLELEAQLQTLADCTGPGCRAADGGP